MIPYDFEYYRPSTIREAVHLHHQLTQQGKQPLYYSGGTEIISLGRINIQYTGAVIDIKRISDCLALTYADEKLMLGSALTLNELYDSKTFPLLGESAVGIADRTTRNKITLGGNICGRFIYKEAVLPLLLTDCKLQIALLNEIREVSIHQLFHQTLHLKPSELLVTAIIDKKFIDMPYVVMKKRKQAAIDYPLVTLAALNTGKEIRVAFSGVCSFPFRSKSIEEVINNRHLSVQSRIDEAVKRLPAPILNDIKASSEYREWVLKGALTDVIHQLGGEYLAN